MSGTPKVRSANIAEPEVRSVLVPGGNMTRPWPVARKSVLKSSTKVEKSDPVAVETAEEKERTVPLSPVVAKSPSRHSASVLKRREFLVRSNLSLNASCSSDASTESFCSRASTGRIGRTSFTRWPRLSVSKPEKSTLRLEKVIPDGIAVPADGKRRCAWVTPNIDPCYAAFHDEEWGVPTHDDKKLFELLVLSGSLAELTWPLILSRRQIFREVFMDFDPVAVSKFNEKKILAPGSTASSLLSEPRLRAIMENARQILKIIEEFGSFDKYCWSFVNGKPILSRYRYPHQVPAKTPKADAISKDLMKRGFRSVSPTVIYSFMQASGMANDHLVNCYRYDKCVALTVDGTDRSIIKDVHETDETSNEDTRGINLQLLTRG